MTKGILRTSGGVALAGLVLGFAALASASALADSEVAVIVNAPVKVVQGSSFAVSVDIGDVATLDAGQFDVSFDESLVVLDSVTAGQIGATQIPIDLWNKIGTGTYRIIVNVPGVPGVNGSGNLAVLQFHAVNSAVGTVTMNLSNGFLNDNLAEEIPATWSGASVVVFDTPDLAAGDTADRPVFRWWILSAIVGAAVVLMAAMIAGVLLRRRQMMIASQRFRGLEQRMQNGRRR